ncbi:hypothetical protein EH215_03936 [Phocaeicola vulgatus]|jgi:hypothetical protein|uniref:Uncharacterized protein n=1 Tax=Phocaeicola vulgatus TaxID=821 RepID=A0A662ZUS3_PHOVU|nr:hypothetical protein EH214_03970 [Phocaeicola vulgatus]TSE51181.1 hypothetical protein EH215_03936 [Phocaeicola vulgatus]
MAYEMVMPYHLHMPSYFLETFTEYPYNNTTADPASAKARRYYYIKTNRYFSIMEVRG